MQHFVAIAVFAFATGCVGRGPQVLTPVRVDTVHVVGSPPAVTVMRPIFTTTDDPFHRVDRMDWPGPNAFRMASGAPGPDYWQQRADYTIAATLDTATKRIRGTVSIHYTNNSPDTLRFVWLQLDQNLYRSMSKGSAMFPA